MTSVWLVDGRKKSHVEEIHKNWSCLENHFPITFWDVLNVNANRIRLSVMSTEKCSNHEFLLEQPKNCHGGKKSHAEIVA